MANVNILRGFTENFEVYYEGIRKLGIATVDFPELNPSSIEIKGVGVAGTMNMPASTQLDNMELTIHWRTIHDDLTQLLADRAHTLAFYSSQRNYDSATGLMVHQQVIVDVRGVPAGLPFGKLEPAATTDSDNKLNLDWIKVRVDGKELIEFDRFNQVYRINGADYYSKIRSNLGL